MAISYTSLIHPKIQIAIATAIRKAVDMSFENQRAGQAVLSNGIEVFYSKRFGLMFFKNNKDITKSMVKALRSY